MLLDWRRANVAVTRAKHKLILIGSASTLRCSNLFKLLLDLVVEREWVSLPEKDRFWPEFDGAVCVRLSLIRPDNFGESKNNYCSV